VIVADTDVLLDYFAGREPSAAAVLRAREQNELVTTTVNRYEVLAGARTDAVRQTYLNLLDAIPVLPLDIHGSDRAAEVFRQLEGRGQRIEAGDCLIAGITLQHGATLLTRNRKHFERVKGLTLA